MNSFRLISQYDFLSSIEIYIKECYDIYNQQANALREQWNDLVISLQHNLDVVTPNTSNEYSVGQELRDIVNSFMDNRECDIDVIVSINNQLIEPLNKAVDECKRKFPEVRSYLAVYECARKMSLLFNQWKTLTRGYSEVFSGIVSTIEESLGSLEQAVDYFENSTKVKN